MSARLMPVMLAPFLLHADKAPVLAIRGREQAVTLLASPRDHDTAVLFLPGDGGWRGLAITIAQTVSRWDYDVYGFDTRRYLESFSQNNEKLTAAEMRQDLHHVIDLLHRQAGIGAEEQGMVHDPVRSRKLAGDSHGGRIITTQLDEDGLANEVAAEQHPVADLPLVEFLREFGAGEGGILPDGDLEAEPRAVRATSG